MLKKHTPLDQFKEFHSQLAQTLNENYFERDFREETEEICQRVRMTIRDMVEHIPQSENDVVIGAANMWLDVRDDIALLKDRLIYIEESLAARDSVANTHRMTLLLERVERSTGNFIDTTKIEPLIGN